MKHRSLFLMPSARRTSKRLSIGRKTIFDTRLVESRGNSYIQMFLIRTQTAVWRVRRGPLAVFCVTPAMLTIEQGNFVTVALNGTSRPVAELKTKYARSSPIDIQMSYDIIHTAHASKANMSGGISLEELNPERSVWSKHCNAYKPHHTSRTAQLGNIPPRRGERQDIMYSTQRGDSQDQAKGGVFFSRL